MPIFNFTVPFRPADEESRQASLDACGLSREPTAAFNALVAEAAQALRAPMAIIGIIDRDEMWSKASFGLDRQSRPRSTTFCAHAILEGAMLLVPDATKDARFSGNPHVIASMGLRYYAGVPIKLKDGAKVGVLSAIDIKPRSTTGEREVAALKAFADRAAVLIDAGRASMGG